MARFFHVTTASYTPGTNLMSWDRYVDSTGEFPCDWKWDGCEPGEIDGSMVCVLREDQVDEIEDIAGFISGVAMVLTLDIDEGWQEELGFGINDEGYTAAMYGEIPAHLIVSMEAVAWAHTGRWQTSGRRRR